MNASLVREVFEYEPETGLLIWRVDVTLRVLRGMIAGSRHKNGYIRVGYKNTTYAVHRLIFLGAMGRWPNGDVDHKDLDKSNNRWDNLREASRQQNVWNRPVRSDSGTGFKGVMYKPVNPATYNWYPRYEANIRIDGKRVYLGSRATAEEASELYKAAAEKLHLEFART